MNEQPAEWPDPESMNPEKFEQLLVFFRELRNLTDQIQKQIAESLLQDPKFKERIDRDKNRSEEWMMGQIDMGIRVFTGIIPLALINGVNPFMSALTMHTGITGKPLIQALIDELNFESLE